MKAAAPRRSRLPSTFVSCSHEAQARPQSVPTEQPATDRAASARAALQRQELTIGPLALVTLAEQHLSREVIADCLDRDVPAEELSGADAVTACQRAFDQLVAKRKGVSHVGQ